ncbi:EamA family transporter [Streptomyces sp. NBC_00250]|uniref:EamA family transporter n=1 Tax=Streptomyces sp. NBC_00250 TaxID=2903641 RepID=UPI002E2C7F5E|nr:EamA family transporter [Streptomyces sp. NBC_00250]
MRPYALGAVPAPLLLLTGMVSLQFGSAFAKRLFEQTGPTGATLLRLLIAAALLCLLSRPAPRLLRTHWRLLLPYGAVFAVMQFSFYEATSRLPLGVVVTLEFSGPLLLAALTSRRALDRLRVALAGLGLLALGGTKGMDDPVGLAASLLTGAALTGYILLGARVGRAVPGGSGLALGLTVAAVLALPTAPVLGLPSPDVLLDPGVLAAALAVAVLTTVVPFSLEFAALRRMPPRVFAVLSTVEPVIAALVGLALLGERLSWLQWAAVLCVVGAAVGTGRAAAGTPTEAGPPDTSTAPSDRSPSRKNGVHS